MTIEEISKYAILITYGNQCVILKFKDGKEIIGNFDDNAENVRLKNNKWNFFVKPQKNKITINGDDLESITMS